MAFKKGDQVWLTNSLNEKELVTVMDSGSPARSTPPSLEFVVQRSDGHIMNGVLGCRLSACEWLPKVGDPIVYRGDMGRIRHVFPNFSYTIETYLPMRSTVYKTYECVPFKDMRLVTDATMLRYIPS